MKKHVCSQLTGLGLVRDGGWRGWGTKTTYCAPFVPWSDRQGSDTASQDGSPTSWSFPETSTHSVLLPGDASPLCSLYFSVPYNDRNWMHAGFPSRQRVPAGRYTQLSTCLVLDTRCCLCPQVALCGCFWFPWCNCSSCFFATSYWTFFV